MKLRCGVVGAGRRRNGLGPYLARFVEAGGGVVRAVAGRDAGRTATDAAELGAALGHPVDPFVGVEAMLAATELDLLVVASPVGAHREAIAAATAAGVAVLCEKPLLPTAELADVPALLAAHAATGRPFLENCQWPEVVPDVEALLGRRPGQPPTAAAMGMGPTGTGRAMLEDSLVHFLSVLQAVLPVDATTAVADVEVSTTAPAATDLELRFTLERPFPAVACRFVARHTPEQPRPAWLELDGARADRLLTQPGYRISFVHETSTGRSERPVEDPLARLVYRFLDLCRTPPDADELRRERERIQQRARLLAALLGHV